ncbi:MAG: AbrB/MazE/SpoVT family DNA-binding domain-containing protein [Lentisphaeria bacterium]|nr:AbrB/MazE/SpoVT family DNA-binding domain-containing protein [Lentisphaeria bacterium]
MKATGIVRRIDDLGRVVIPKEIRRTMRIREGDRLLTKSPQTDKRYLFTKNFILLAERLGATAD